MGQTAILGSYTKPIIDISIIAQKGILPNVPKQMIENLEKIGYVYCGPSPNKLDINYHLFMRKCLDDEIKETFGN